MKKNRVYLNLILFILTYATTTMAGTAWSMHNPSEILDWQYGILYSTLIMIFISSHEFGHYFASRFHGVKATLPYYIPAIPEYMLFGTFGAVIKTKSPIPTQRALFDIGVAGPIAGFVVCVIFLIIGFITLPPKDFIYQLHPEYLTMLKGEIPDISLFFGDTILYSILSKLLANPQGWLPPLNEIYHYPFLCVGWFGLFVTSLNMLPIGQLDGGHVTYAMFGKYHIKIARIVWWLIFAMGILGSVSLMYELFSEDYPNGIYITIQNAIMPGLIWLKVNVPLIFTFWSGWLFWALVTRFFIKLEHPPVASDDDEPLDMKRKIFGWLAIVILILSFAYNGIYVK